MSSIADPPSFEQIAELPIWVVSEKETRRPLNGHDGAYDGDATDASTWVSCTAAKATLARGTGRPINGAAPVLGELGLVLVNIHPWRLVGWDFDAAFQSDGTLWPFVRDMVELLDGAYVERSPSGQGLHIIGFALADELDQMGVADWSVDFKAPLAPAEIVPGGKTRWGVEIYLKGYGRFLTWTGNVFEGRAELGAIDADQIARSHIMAERAFPDPKNDKPKRPRGPVPDWKKRTYQWFHDQGLVLGPPSRSGWEPVACPWQDEHGDHKMDGRPDSGVAISADYEGHPVFKCHHASHAGRSLRDVWRAKIAIANRPIILEEPAKIAANAQEAFAALVAQGEVYRRGRALVVPDASVILYTRRGKQQHTAVAVLGPANLKRYLDQAAGFLRISPKTGELVPTFPTTRLCSVLMEYVGDQPTGLPVLDGVMLMPFLRDDDSIRTAPGYDEGTAIFCHFNAQEAS